jgi:hypothetical protein
MIIIDDDGIMHKVLPMDTLDKIRAELKDYITHSPYIKSFMDCCRLRDDVMRIIDKYKAERSE